MDAFFLLLHNPFAFSAYILLICSIIACWIAPKYYLFAPLYIASYSLAYFGGVVTYPSLFPLLLLIASLALLKCNVKRFIHLFASMIVAIAGVGIITHMIVGFNNLLLLSQVTYGNSNVFMNLYLNFDKVSLAIFLLGLNIKVLQTKESWKQTLIITIPWIAFSVFIFLGFSKMSHLVALDIKLPSTTAYWLIINLFFVVIPEEAFFRGFLQHEIVKNLKNKAAPALAILTVSLLFTLIHLFFSLNISFLVVTFIASVLYGTIFYFSGSIESAIITHFSVNVIHFFFFTYPYIQVKV